MYIQVYGGNLVACADYPFIGHTSEVSVDYKDYIGNPNNYKIEKGKLYKI